MDEREKNRLNLELENKKLLGTSKLDTKSKWGPISIQTVKSVIVMTLLSFLISSLIYYQQVGGRTKSSAIDNILLLSFFQIAIPLTAFFSVSIVVRTHEANMQISAWTGSNTEKIIHSVKTSLTFNKIMIFMGYNGILNFIIFTKFVDYI